MNRLVRVPFLLLAVLPVFAVVAEGVVSVQDLETQFGPLQGQMELRSQTVLMFPSAKVKIFHETGEAKIERIEAPADSLNSTTRPTLPDLRTLKRKINRLPAHEQVRYWKLHQIRYPESDVSNELELALDLMEVVRSESIASNQQETEEVETESRSYNRNHSPSSYFPSYRFSSGYRYHRARHKDTQIELDRIQRAPRPVENFTTAMSLADRARSQAYSTVSGARSEALQMVSGARSANLGNIR